MPVYDFICDTCGRKESAFAWRHEDLVPPRCPTDDVEMRRRYTTGGQIIRPHGYHLRPGDKGYWDFGEHNLPGYEPPEQIEPFAAYREAERDIAAAAARGDEDE